MIEFLANVDEVCASARGAWKPPPRLSVSDWADQYFYLSAESSAEPGRWRTLPYQRAWLDAFSDPRVERISVMKSARVGYTKCIDAVIGYFMHQDPCSLLVVQPTVEDAKGFSKEEIAPMIRDCPELERIVKDEDAGPKDSSNTILHKTYPGGILSMVGANSGAGFRRISRRVVLFDEVDGYPPSAGSDGDPIKLGTMRTQAFWNRKIGEGSTPLAKGTSKIEGAFADGDQRRYHVPCPHCGHRAPFIFRRQQEGQEDAEEATPVVGHWMEWSEGDPWSAYFVCCNCGCEIEEKDKRTMIAAGEWVAAKSFDGHASFHIWAAYSPNANATWGHIAAEFYECRRDPEKLKTFVNTWLGETWRERGVAPAYELLFGRREHYPIGSVPDGVKVITAGMDVQKDRVVYEIVGWGERKRSWSIDAGVIPFNTSDDAEWATHVDPLLERQFVTASGASLAIRMTAIDSGYNTQTVYSYCSRFPMSRVIAVKGMDGAGRPILGAPSPITIKPNGKRPQRGYKVWPVGTYTAKTELYGWLGRPAPRGDQSEPPGWCHFPEYGEDYFKQLTAEQLTTTVSKRTRHVRHEWQVISGRENHQLDARVYARAAAYLIGIDRIPSTSASPPAPPPVAPAATPAAAVPGALAQPTAPPAAPSRPRPKSGFLHGGSGIGNRGKGWLR